MIKTHLRLTLVALLCACGGEQQAEPSGQPTAQAPAAPPASDHGERLELGSVTLAGYEFTMTRLGELVPGVESAIEVRLVQSPNTNDVSDLNVYVWVEDESGTDISGPRKGLLENGVLHCHVLPRPSDHPPIRAVLRLRVDDIDVRDSLPLDGHGHEHVATPHDGVLAQFNGPGGELAGHLELKLHDDKGDLELWLATDPRLEHPFDLPMQASIQVNFIDLEGRNTQLRVRNQTLNEDEDGNPNLRDGRTNYFIFPTSPAQESDWLRGEDFQSIVQVSFEVEGLRYVSEEFVLTPHVHLP
jgi:hypothetical protein